MFSKYFLPRVSLEQTLIIKGMAIVAIVIHNFTHLLPPRLGENQILFNPDLLWRYVDYAVQHPDCLLQLIFSYLGHLGVPVFIFLSGYGLTRSYQIKTTYLPAFITKKILSIYKLMLTVLCVSIVISMVWPLPQKPLDLIWHMMRHALLIHNFSAMWYEGVGPWWYFDCILQLYLLFAPLYIALKKYGLRATLVLLITFSVILYGEPWFRGNYGLHLYTIFIGHVSVFAFGIYLGQNPSLKIPYYLCWLSFFVFCLSNILEVFFPLSGISFVGMLLPFLASGADKSACRKHHLWHRLGLLSPYIFGLNGLLRLVIIPKALNESTSSWSQLYYTAINLLMAVLIAWAFDLGLKKIKRVLVEWKNQYKKMGNAA